MRVMNCLIKMITIQKLKPFLTPFALWRSIKNSPQKLSLLNYNLRSTKKQEVYRRISKEKEKNVKYIIKVSKFKEDEEVESIGFKAPADLTIREYLDIFKAILSWMSFSPDLIGEYFNED